MNFAFLFCHDSSRLSHIMTTILKLYQSLCAFLKAPSLQTNGFVRQRLELDVNIVFLKFETKQTT